MLPDGTLDERLQKEVKKKIECFALILYLYDWSNSRIFSNMAWNRWLFFENSHDDGFTFHGFMRWFYLAAIGIVTLIFSWLGARATKVMKAWVLTAIFGILIGIILKLPIFGRGKPF